MLFAHRGVGFPRNAGAVDIDARMPAEHIGENQGVDGFGEKAKRQRSHAIQDLERLVGVQEGALHVIDVPKQRLVPVPLTFLAIGRG